VTDRSPSDELLQQRVQRLAEAAGFARGGIAALPAEDSPEAARHAAYFEEWIAQGYAGEMDYLKRRDESGRLLRSAAQLAAPWAKSIILCAAPYSDAQLPLSTDPAPASTGWIARYAWSGKTSDRPGPSEETVPSDYHKVLLRRLKALEISLAAELGAAQPHFQSWAYVDTGPVVERAYSALTGLGWTGKNTCTLNQEIGSFFFLGTILTSLEVPIEERAVPPADRCGSCTRCIDACPTDALIAPYQMDASRCISYLTIEKRGPIDPSLREGMGRQIFGCDICQDVCPWNERQRRAAPHTAAGTGRTDLNVRKALVNPPLAALAALSQAEWEKLFFGSPIARARFSGFRRNLAIAIGNSRDTALCTQVAEWAAQTEDETLREAAVWALAQLQPAPESAQTSIQPARFRPTRDA
jgi:epoxyqueuosine reductase